MNQSLLTSLFNPSLFANVAVTMFSIGTGLLLVYGAWKAYSFVKAAVVGSFTGVDEASVAAFNERFADYDPNEASPTDDWDDEQWDYYYNEHVSGKE